MLNRLKNLSRWTRICAVEAIVALVLMVVLVVVWLIPGPPYVATGVIRIEPNDRRILYPMGDDRLLRLFQSYVQSQAEFLRRDRFLRRSMEHDEWRSTSERVGNRPLIEFVKCVAVRHPPDSNLIIVSFTDPDRNAALSGVRSIVMTYENIFSVDGNRAPDRIERLRTRRELLRSEIDELAHRIARHRENEGTGHADESLVTKSSRLEGLLAETENRIEQLTTELASGGQVEIVIYGEVGLRK